MNHTKHKYISTLITFMYIYKGDFVRKVVIILVQSPSNVISIINFTSDCLSVLSNVPSFSIFSIFHLLQIIFSKK